MTPDEVRQRLRQFLDQDDPNLIVTIPAGSGICHIADVPAKDWISGFASSNPGRWNLSGEHKKYFADKFEICAAELCGTDIDRLKNCVFERWQTCEEIRAFNITKFPEDLRVAFYEDKGEPPDKWIKPHIFVEEAMKSEFYRDVHSIVAPTASGKALGIDGIVFVTYPDSQKVELLQTGTCNTWL